MPWNWQLPNWPKFHYDPKIISTREKKFLLEMGSASAFIKSLVNKDYNQFVVEILSIEGLESSKIEGEPLDRESLQSSIKQNFGLKSSSKKSTPKETGMAHLLCNIYESFNEPLTHDMLHKWHSMLFEKKSHNLADLGKYRSHTDPMQIISNRYDTPKFFFEAPPSSKILREMSSYVDWFNTTKHQASVLGRAAIAHIYFESIHPFEDGNGRIGRVLVEKVFSQEIERPVLISISRILEKRKKEYYAALESCNRSLNANTWVDFFTDAALQAQHDP